MQTWREAWTPGQKLWCCSVYHRGCEAPHQAGRGAAARDGEASARWRRGRGRAGKVETVERRMEGAEGGGGELRVSWYRSASAQNSQNRVAKTADMAVSNSSGLNQSPLTWWGRSLFWKILWTPGGTCFVAFVVLFHPICFAKFTTWRSSPTSQRPHFTGDGHTKPILKEVKDQVLLGQTGLVGFQNMPHLIDLTDAILSPYRSRPDPRTPKPGP